MPSTIRMLSNEEEIYAHFTGMGLDDYLEVTPNDLWITVNIRLVETIDETKDGSCNDNEDYKKSGILKLTMNCNAPYLRFLKNSPEFKDFTIFILF